MTKKLISTISRKIDLKSIRKKFNSNRFVENQFISNIFTAFLKRFPFLVGEEDIKNEDGVEDEDVEEAEEVEEVEGKQFTSILFKENHVLCSAFRCSNWHIFFLML